MQLIRRISSIIALSTFVTCFAPTPPHTVSTFFRPLPEISTSDIRTKGSYYSPTLKKFVTFAPTTASTTGIIAIYLGYWDTSDENGQIIFPRKLNKPRFKIVVTPDIEPVFIIPNVIDHWRIVPGKPSTHHYVTQQVAKGKRTWKTRRIKNPRKDILDLETIIIIADPESIFIPLGETPTTKDEQLVLPVIYTMPDQDAAVNALTLMDDLPFLGQLQHAKSAFEQGYQERISP